jgi:formylglycine-generating enzyme required for sulfatase activity
MRAGTAIAVLGTAATWFACTPSSQSSADSNREAVAPMFVRPGEASAASSATEAAAAQASAAANPSSAPTVAPAVATASARDAAVEFASPHGTMRLVAGGEFTMGSDTLGEPDERPAHSVHIAPFYLDITEVTQSAYAACVRAGRCREPEPATLGRNGGRFIDPNKPVIAVSWQDGVDFCAFANKRLPREAEFERAVRGDDNRLYPWGNAQPTHELTVFEVPVTAVVGSRPAGRGPYGHDDLAGNVWEWVQDLYDPLAYSRAGRSTGTPGTCEEILVSLKELRADGKRGFTGSNPIPLECEHAIRGGAFNYPGGRLRATNRVHHPGTYRLMVTGFRCAKDL